MGRFDVGGTRRENAVAVSAAVAFQPWQPVGAAHRGILHKIGVMGGSVGSRIDNARLDPTFLLADVEIVATCKLSSINRKKLGNIVHRIFDVVRLNLKVKDCLGHPVIPREWFFVPFFVIGEAVDWIKDGSISSISSYQYDPGTASLKRSA